MPNLLGLSIDVNGIGWALLNKADKSIISMGTRVFPIGCENFGSGRRELSKKAYKRFKRTTRFRYQRSRKRKIKVLEILIENQMCPLSKENLDEWKNKKKFPNEELKDWLKMNPYQLRWKAVFESISLIELGRVLYQISIHRGFPESDRNRGVKENTMYSGIPHMNRLGINETKNKIIKGKKRYVSTKEVPKSNSSIKYSPKNNQMW